MKTDRNGKPKMRVSFDLDEVLFVLPETHKTEPPLRFPFNLIYKERLRIQLIKNFILPEGSLINIRSDGTQEIADTPTARKYSIYMIKNRSKFNPINLEEEEDREIKVSKKGQNGKIESSEYKKAIVEIIFSNFTIYVFQGGLSQFDILIKYIYCINF